MSGVSCRLKVKAVPGASRSEIVGRLGAALKAERPTLIEMTPRMVTG